MKQVMIFVLAVIVSSETWAVEDGPTGIVTGYYTGWGTDQVRVTIEGADYSEGNCPTKDGYITKESDNSGYKTHTSALLSAYLAGVRVKIVVDGCISNRPRIWGVYLYK